MRTRSILLLAMLAFSAAGCAIAGTGVAEPAIVGADQPMVWPECQTAELAFAGESTLSAIGLGEFAGGPDANKVGMIWVTAGPVAMGGPAPPMPVGGGKGADIPAARMVCVQWPDGSGMAGNIPDEWVLPEQVPSTVAAEETGAGLPVGVLALVGGAAVLIGVSVVAFRREGGA